MKHRSLIKKNDFNRILVTETLPFETPIIFSNDGLYDRVSSVDTNDEIQAFLVKTLVTTDREPTVPYSYKVRKNSTEYRRLALLHPASQWKIRLFYEKYGQLILHYCSESPASIRSPQKIAGSFYTKSSWENVNRYKFKSGGVSLSKADQYARHAPSYFSYRGYDRLYKFFNSRQYFSLEKRYPILQTLDVSKCFDSIYTHCLSWAVKEKPFTKEFKRVSSTFGQEFDETIRHGNHNETNGIPIGPESSRVFAEILFQKIDLLVINRLQHLKFGVQYTFRRYVDDVFIFADSETVASTVYTVYADVLTSFNLHANVAKSTTSVRPFVTSKSRLINESSDGVNDFFDKFLELSTLGTLKPKPILSAWKLTRSYIESVKSLCSESDANYDEVASFLIAVFTERIKKLVNLKKVEVAEAVPAHYMRAFEVLLDIQFFLYSVAPSVGSSYKLSTSLILTLRFYKEHFVDDLPTISQRIYELSSTLLLDQCGRPHGAGVRGFVHLECLNILLAIRELNDPYLLPESIIQELFVSSKSPLGYFTIVSCLFYIKDDARYTKIRNILLEKVRLKLRDLSDIKIDSEKAYLLLDMISCPLISSNDKQSWITKLYGVLGTPVPTKAVITAFLDSTYKATWQIDWGNVDLLNSLEKKELKQAY